MVNHTNSTVTEKDLDEIIEKVEEEKNTSQPEEVLTDPSSLDQLKVDMDNLYRR